MKILHVTDYLPELHETVGGAEFAARRVIDQLVASGADIEVATLQMTLDQPPMPWGRHYEIRNLDGYAPRLAFAVKQLYLPGDARATAGFDQVLATSRPDVVHFHNLHFSGLGVIRAARARRIPTVLSIYDYWLFCPAFMLLTNRNELCRRGHGAHCVDCIGTRRLPALRPIKRALFQARPRVFRRYVDAVDRFTVLSNASRELLLSQHIEPHKIAVIPQYIWDEAARLERTHEPVPGRLVYVGWVEARKGLHIIIEALALLAKDFPQLHLEVLGLPANQEYAREIERLIASHEIGARVHIRGKVSRADLLRELQQAMLVTVPEQWENMSPVILTETMAMGACALGSRVGGIREFVQEFATGLLAERDKPDEFATRIRWALQHPEQMMEIRTKARARARELFDPAVITNKTLDLYRTLIAAPAPTGG